MTTWLATARELRREGFTCVAIASRLGMSHWHVSRMTQDVEISQEGKARITARRAELGRRTSSIKRPENDARIIESYARGVPVAAIAAALGVTRCVVIGRARRLGLRHGNPS